MAFSKQEIEALTMLLREEVVSQIQDFRDENTKQHHELSAQIDGLYKRVETVEQEYFSICEQVKRLETQQ